MIRTQVQLKESQSARLRQLAAREGISFSEAVRRALEAGLGQARAASPEQARQRAMEVAGRFRSGASDVAARHDEYLARAYRS